MPQTASKNITTFITNLYSKNRFKNLFWVNLLINSCPTSSESAARIHINNITKLKLGIPPNNTIIKNTTNVIKWWIPSTFRAIKLPIKIEV